MYIRHMQGYKEDLSILSLYSVSKLISRMYKNFFSFLDLKKVIFIQDYLKVLKSLNYLISEFTSVYKWCRNIRLEIPLESKMTESWGYQVWAGYHNFYCQVSHPVNIPIGIHGLKTINHLKILFTVLFIK